MCSGEGDREVLMSTSFVRHIIGAGFGSFLCTSVLALSGCAHDANERATTVQFAVTSASASAAMEPVVRLGEVRVLSKRVNLQERVVLDATGPDVLVTFATRQREGLAVAVDASSLELRRSEPFTFATHAKYEAPPFVAPLRAQVNLEGSGTLSCWTDEASSRVVAQAYDASGNPRGEPVAVSPAGTSVIGVPQAASADGRHVVVTFFAIADGTFELVAASVDAR
jgi:hypothetical protein